MTNDERVRRRVLANARVGTILGPILAILGLVLALTGQLEALLLVPLGIFGYFYWKPVRDQHRDPGEQ